MANYINPFTDIGFKRIFGQELSKPLLIDFLNNLLIGEKRIVNLKFLDKELPPVFVDDRSLIYDIYCELDNKEKIIVEMQNCEQSYFKRRSIYYVSEAIARQGEKGPEWQYDIKGVYLIAFLNFRRPDIGEEFRTDVILMNRKSKEIFSDKLRLVYLQLPLFEKGVEACENDFDRWPRLYLRISHLFRQLGKYFSPIWEINCPKLAYLTRFLFSQSGMEIS